MAENAQEPQESRPSLVGDDSGPSAPFPVELRGPVISGFGRGSRELGIPTANIPTTDLPATLDNGIYFGFASLPLTADGAPADPPTVYPMVVSVGWNPFYKNTERSVEVHLLEKFARDFYGLPLRALLLGFVRPERNYESTDALVADINMDIAVTRSSLAREAWARWREDPWLKESDGGQ